MTTMLTFGDVSDRVQRMVKGTRRETLNQLAVACDNAQTDIQLLHSLDGISEGSFLGIEEEILYVFAVNTATSTLTVRRGMFNTTPAAHSTTVLVEVDWRWFTADVIDAIVDEIQSWPTEIYRVRTAADISVIEGTTAYDIPLTGFRHPLRARHTRTDNDRWVELPVGQYNIETNLPTADFASGNAVFLLRGLRASTLRIEYASDFTVGIGTFDATTTIAALGLNATLMDALLYGAAGRLLLDREPQRSSIESQPEPRQARDVPRGSATQTAASYLQLRDRRLTEEARRLRGLFPVRFA